MSSAVSIIFSNCMIITKGHIVEFDLTSGKQTMALDEAHPPGSAVIQTKFTDDPSVALICDSGGSVYEVQLSRIH